ncbi:MAG: GNAT family N-acetyltransferase [Bacillota bacterium]
MERISLQLPGPEHEFAANQFKDEFFACGEFTINGSALFDRMEYGEWLAFITRNRSEETRSPGWVVATTFFGVRETDQRIVGMIDIRHSLGSAFLAEYGGHIGYSVRPSERRKGYAVQMLELALDYARSIPLLKVMLGCYADNMASIRTLLKCDGVLKEVKSYLDGKPMHIYWIDLG